MAALLIIGALIAAFLVYATRKGWVSWKGGHGLAALTAFHDVQTRDRQEAIEYVMDRSAGKKMEEQESGEPLQD